MTALLLLNLPYFSPSTHSVCGSYVIFCVITEITRMKKTQGYGILNVSLGFYSSKYDSALYGDSKISTGKCQLYSFSMPLVPLIYNFKICKIA